MARVYVTLAVDVPEENYDGATTILDEATFHVTGPDYGLGNPPIKYESSIMEYSDSLQ